MTSYSPLTLEKLKKKIHAALRAWHRVGGEQDYPLDSLRLVRARHLTMSTGEESYNRRLCTNLVLLDGIEALEARSEIKAKVVRLRFPDNETIVAVASRLNMSEHSVSRIQREGIVSLAQIIFDWEMALREELAQALEADLEPKTYSALFGTDGFQEKLLTSLLQAQAPWVVALVGMGGIGKTSLADIVTRKIVREFVFKRVIWLRTEPVSMNGRSLSPELTFDIVLAELTRKLWPKAAPLSSEQQLVRVRQALKTEPHLIVIDNLERDTAHLLIYLNDLANPSKFLITSRTRPAEQAGVLNITVDELSLDDACGFIRYHAEEIGMEALAAAEDADLEDIYSLTGGNPLALKLVVSLLTVIPLPQILIALNKGTGRVEDELYGYIYRQTWNILSQSARDLLQAMPLVAEQGATPEYLQAIGGLSSEKLWPAIEELRKCSLLEVRGTFKEKRYGIHRLTDTFLRTEIIDWPEEGEQ